MYVVRVRNVCTLEIIGCTCLIELLLVSPALWLRQRASIIVLRSGKWWQTVALAS